MNIKRLLFVCLLFLFPSVASSQITINQTDFTSIYSIGSTYYSAGDTLNRSVNIGQPGGGNNWDFSNFVPHFSLELNFIDPSATPFADSFATANIANYISQTFDDGSGETGTSESWAYFNSSDGSTHGSISNTTFISSGETFTSQTVTRHFPPFVQYDFPITANKVWSKKDSSTTMSISNGMVGLVSNVSTTYNIIIDAWGSMTLPGGKTIEALRSREQEITTSYFFGVPIGTDVSVTYFFMAKTGESFSILAEDEDPANSGTITGSVGWFDDNVTSVEKLKNIPTEFSLKQNYPNPFNPSTNIEYSIIKPSHVSLRVYDILGNEVARLVNEDQTIGNYRIEFDGSGLSSGTYFVQLTAGDFSKVRKISLIK
jgi:hypothetical protein